MRISRNLNLKTPPAVKENKQWPFQGVLRCEHFQYIYIYISSLLDLNPHFGKTVLGRMSRDYLCRKGRCGGLIFTVF